MVELNQSGNFFKSLVIIGVVISLGVAWVSTSGHGKSPINLIDGSKESDSGGGEVLDSSELKASGDIDWSLIYSGDRSQRNRVREAIDDASKLHNVDPDLLRAVIMTESVFNPAAVSRKGARGLMQLMPGTANEVEVADPHDPRANILGGTAYLASLIKDFKGDLRLALAAYNAGPQRVKNNGGVIPPDIVPYVNRVMSYYQFFGGERVRR